jgi:hypothetical protein
MGLIAKKNDIFKTNSPESLGSLAYKRFSPFFFFGQGQLSKFSSLVLGQVATIQEKNLTFLLIFFKMSFIF